MPRNRYEEMNCGVAQALDQFGDGWTVLIVRDAFFGKSRFSEFQESLGIAKNILSDRLQKLVCLLYTSPSPRDQRGSRMPSSA